MKRTFSILGAIKIVILLTTLSGCHVNTPAIVEEQVKEETSKSLKYKDFVMSATVRTYLLHGHVLKERGGESMPSLVLVTSETILTKVTPAVVSFKCTLSMINPKNKEDNWKVVRTDDYDYDSQTETVLWDRDNLANMHSEMLKALEDHLEGMGFTSDENKYAGNME